MQPSATSESKQTGVEPRKNDAFEAYITFCALGGLTVTDDGTVTKMTLEEFLVSYGVHRTTVWRWKKNTPDLAEKIRTRRLEIVPIARETAAWNQLFLLGMQNKDKRAAVDALKAYLGHFSDMQLPVQRQDIKVKGSLAELMSSAEKEFIEGEIVDGPPRSQEAIPDASGMAPEA